MFNRIGVITLVLFVSAVLVALSEMVRLCDDDFQFQIINHATHSVMSCENTNVPDCLCTNDKVVVDRKTFERLEFGYSKDRYRVYYDYCSGKVIEGADPSTFEVLDDLVFSKDKHHVYRQYEIGKINRMENVDVKTFRKYSDDGYFADIYHLYSIAGETLY